MTKILLDGIIFKLQPFGGISVYFNELMKYLSYSKVSYTCLLNDRLKIIPSGTSSANTFFIRNRILERFRSVNKYTNNMIFHSSYYRVPNYKIPTVVTVHDFIYERYSDLIRKKIHSYQKYSSINSASRIICVSETTRQDFINYYGDSYNDIISVIPNGVSNSYYPLNIYNTNNTPFILYVGSRAKYKNFNYLIKTLELMPDINLLCVGSPFNSDELSNIPYSLKFKIHNLGFISNSELNILYNKALCLVYPSSYEGFGIPVIEAMKAGCPVVSNENCKAILEVGCDALVLSQLNPESLMNAINSLRKLSFRQEKIKLGFANSSKYSWELTHSKTLDIYLDLIRNG